MLVKPAPGLVMRDPVTRQFVPEGGLEVSPDDLYWARALRDGDVVDATAAKPVEGVEITDEPLAGAGEGTQIPTKDQVTGEDIPPAVHASELGALAEPHPDAPDAHPSSEEGHEQ